MNIIYCKNRREWREWLAANHNTETEVWFVYYKKNTGVSTVSYEESVREALCFGWIDSIKKKLDEQRYCHKFTPRNPGSKWSPSNKQRVAELISDNLMTPAGMEKVEYAQKNGLWDQPDRQQISFEFPPEFKAALEKSPKAQNFFNGLTEGYRKHYIAWIATAKRSETREKRVKESVRLLENGEKLGMR